ncbi:unnamed protein product [Boreogadus saida]
MHQSTMMANAAQPGMDIGLAGHQFSQQQAPPNQTAPWPDSMMPIDQTALSTRTGTTRSPRPPRTGYARPPPTPQNRYAVPPTPQNRYAVPPTPQNRYAVPPTPQNRYAVPPTPQNRYAVPPTPQNRYAVPPTHQNRYGVPPTPQNRYAVPPTPQNRYAVPPEQTPPPRPTRGSSAGPLSRGGHRLSLDPPLFSKSSGAIRARPVVCTTAVPAFSTHPAHSPPPSQVRCDPGPQDELCGLAVGHAVTGLLAADDWARMLSPRFYTVLKDFDGLEEIDRPWGSPLW